jgi:hypothetical protein
VLLVSLCGMFITGGVLSMFGIFSGSARRSVSSDMVYNFLEEEVEKAKGALKMEMGGRKLALRRNLNGGHPASLKDLEVLRDDGSPFWSVDDSHILVAGKNGTLTVRVYDMQYDPADITSIRAEDRHLLPPAIMGMNASAGEMDPDGYSEPGKAASTLPGDPLNTGVYLIRASIQMPGEAARSVEVAVTQNANPKAP